MDAVVAKVEVFSRPDCKVTSHKPLREDWSSVIVVSIIT